MPPPIIQQLLLQQQTRTIARLIISNITFGAALTNRIQVPQLPNTRPFSTQSLLKEQQQSTTFAQVFEDAVWEGEIPDATPTPQHDSSPLTNEDQTSTAFSTLQTLSPNTLLALEKEFRYEYMTQVQQSVLSMLPLDRDLLVRAKTGTGKTLAFMIAAIESALHRTNNQLDPNVVSILVLAPTRELVLQLAEEAERLGRSHSMRVRIAVGGVGRRDQIRVLAEGRYEILVATPGRLLDMLENIPNLAKKLEGLQTVSCLFHILVSCRILWCMEGALTQSNHIIGNFRRSRPSFGDGIHRRHAQNCCQASCLSSNIHVQCHCQPGHPSRCRRNAQT